MKLLSWDIGINNLAFCLLEYNCEYKKNKIENIANDAIIHEWMIIDLTNSKKNVPIDKIAITLYNKLDKLFINYEAISNILREHIQYQDINNIICNYLTSIMRVDKVLIENQPCLKNPKMKSIQILLYSYFILRGLVDKEKNDSKINEIVFVSASGKLKYCKDAEIDKRYSHLKSKYTKRKKMAIDYCKKYISDNKLNYFNTHKKKDDLADSYLQALQYFYKIK